MITSILLYAIITFVFITQYYNAIPIWLRVILQAILLVAVSVAFASEQNLRDKVKKLEYEVKTQRKAVNDMDLLQKGWECPKCGAVMSPTTSVCVNCRGSTEVSISTDFIPATQSKDYPPYLDRPKGFNFQKDKGE